jgi:5S rRNA maturation endonuclease (ribonuclease M5)
LLPLEARSVFVVEGEKDVETLRAHGFVATTMAGGANVPWLPSFTQSLSGREVILVPDVDTPGRLHALKVARALIGHASRLIVLELEGAKDITEWFGAGAQRNGTEFPSAPPGDAMIREVAEPSDIDELARLWAAPPPEPRSGWSGRIDDLPPVGAAEHCCGWGGGGTASVGILKCITGGAAGQPYPEKGAGSEMPPGKERDETISAEHSEKRISCGRRRRAAGFCAENQ